MDNPTPKDLAATLFRIASKGRTAYHKDYDRTVEYSRELKAMFGGVDLDSFLKKFARREDDDLFEQRKTITSHLQEAVTPALDRPFEKIGRSNFTRQLSAGTGAAAERTTAELEGTLRGFFAGGLEKYLFDQLRYFNTFDPNAFIAIEFAAFDNRKEKAKPYPFEIDSEAAVDFRVSSHGRLNYLVARQVADRPTKKDATTTKPVERLTIYAPNQTVVLQEKLSWELKEEGLAAPINPTKAIEADPVNGEVLKIGDRFWTWVVPIPHKFGETPAFRTGFIPDPKTRKRTCLSIFNAALPWLRKLLKTNSEFDLVCALMAFPTKIVAEELCETPGCIGGEVNGSKCNTCKGTGFKKLPTSAQEIIRIPFPATAQDAIDPSKLLAYTYPPVEIVTLQKETVGWFLENCARSVFNSQMFSRQETTQTATYHGIALTSVYDTLFPYAQHLSKVWPFAVRAIATFTGFNADQIAANLLFPKEFRFESLEDLLAALDRATKAGASPDAVAIIQRRIMDVMLEDDREALRRWDVQRLFNPFEGMPEASVLAAIAGGLVTEDDKILFVNRRRIFAELSIEEVDFYKKPYPEQRKSVAAKVAQIRSEIAAQTAGALFGAGAVDGTETPDVLGKIPLAVQQLALARERAVTAGDATLAENLGRKIEGLLEQI
jgi:hypothetical protein